MSEAQKVFLERIAPMNIEARYREYKDDIAKNTKQRKDKDYFYDYPQ